MFLLCHSQCNNFSVFGGTATAEQQRWEESVVPAGFRGNCTSFVQLGVVAFWAGVALGTRFFLHISLAKRMLVVSLLLLPFPIKTSACVLTVGKRIKMTSARFLGEFSSLHQTEERIPLKVWLVAEASVFIKKKFQGICARCNAVESVGIDAWGLCLMMGGKHSPCFYSVVMLLFTLEIVSEIMRTLLS